MTVTMSRVLPSGFAALLVFSAAVGVQAAAVVAVKHENVLHVRNNSTGVTVSPFFTHHIGGESIGPSNGWAPIDVTRAADAVNGTAASTTPKKSFSFVGNSTAAGNWTDGNGVPSGITLTFDAEFTISAKQTEPGMMLTMAGTSGQNASGRGIGLTVVNGGADDIASPRRLEFSTVTVSNVSFAGTLADPGFSFTPGGVSSFGVELFESGQFSLPSQADTKGMVLEHSTGTIGFGTTAGSGTTAGAEYSNLRMLTNFGIYADTPVTDPALASSHFPRQSFPFEIGTSAGSPDTMFRGFTLGYDVTYDISPVGAVEDADFNDDDVVDGNDFLIWQRGFGGPGNLPQGDANGDGSINEADLSIWKGQFGIPAVVASAAVPEPSTALLALTASIGTAAIRRGRRVE